MRPWADTDELATLNAGGVVTLCVFGGGHPPVWVSVDANLPPAIQKALNDPNRFDASEVEGTRAAAEVIETFW